MGAVAGAEAGISNVRMLTKDTVLPIPTIEFILLKSAYPVPTPVILVVLPKIPLAITICPTS